MKNKLRRKLRNFLAAALMAVMAITSVPATAMAAEAPVALPVELSTSYSQLAGSEIMPRSTSYFISDQQFSYTGFYTTPSFYVPTACQARLVIAPIGSEPLYIDVLNGKLQSEHTIVATPNQSQVHVFNISAGTHYLKFSSITGSQFTIRLQLYTWDY